mgnify:CR=1 FL=1
MIDDQNFEKAIRTKLVQHESDVPDAMWSGIESRLPKRVPNKVPLYRRIMWYSAAAIVMGVIVTVALWQYPDKEISAPLAVNEDSRGLGDVYKRQESNKARNSNRLKN